MALGKLLKLLGSLLNANSITFTPITEIGEVMFMKCCEILVCVAEVYFFPNKSKLELDTAIKMEETVFCLCC